MSLLTAVGAAPSTEVAGSVELRGLTKAYGSAVAVDNLSLHVQAGEFLSLLGPSGCGKTTTLRMIGGFEFPDDGTIAISGRNVESLPPHKRPVNTVFQAYALFPHMKVADNVAYGLRRSGVPKAEMSDRVSRALDMVRMTAFAARKPAQLSGGQQQRVALARALVNRPAVVLLDEPMSALDRKLREEMQVELKLLQQELGTTFIFVTHDQEEALSMSDRVAVMNDGRIEQIGTASAVYDAPESAFVAGFIGRQNSFTGTISSFDAAGLNVRTAGLALYSTRPAKGDVPAAGGATVTAAIRPESVLVTEQAAPETPASSTAGVNVVSGVLLGVSELGHSLQLVVHTGTDDRILARLPRSANPPTELGAPVSCSWSADAVRIFTS
ncbi:spermidine/putrescine transport system ATP-binding protein [Mycolicibacterium canariasense]|uniref:Spermidine/putrescine transport system ATP-binding protein n=1 Tax=Mycolicibacterium canariasense TaxID=228230 RepID=A0A100WHQ4_MYCCR|nr:ABC transporter ATP-binding protein [Mycolicibacterium canariasense]MCV7210091.1 ABC transporter ATP-binding protein [Mycolicibacterium canariasense]ORV13397.1 spermidine/putrescine ABC transporter ATP-binding protein [Mycolicibacterium canariasense]GAS98411.1 spermidine/putrescine transport system ATP-binding protein [Mycolicibacterium canariasense]